VREVYIDDETKEATVIVPDDQLALAIGKEGLNARLATRLCGWKIDIQSESEFAQAEAEAAFAGNADNEEYSGRCAAILSNGKRCPNAALSGSPYCGVPAHQELVNAEPAAANGDGTVAPVAAEVEAVADGETAEEAVEEQRVEAVADPEVVDADVEAPEAEPVAAMVEVEAEPADDVAPDPETAQDED
jgi:N utilization substance protein A